MPEWGAVIEPTKSDGTSLSESDIKRQERAIDDILVTASQYRGRGTIPAELQGIIDKLLEPQVLWEEELEKFVGGEQPEDYSYKRIHKVALEVLDVLNPTSDRFGSGHLVVGQDQSASVSDKELQKGFSELNYISEKFSPEQVTVIPFDGNVKEDKVQVFDKGEIIEKLDIKGRGGTNVAPLFDYIEKEQMEIDKLIIFSDMEIWDYPKEPPAYPVLWVSVNENGLPAPFGQTIHIK
jgi:predicted metal-dependent peptidase